MDEKASDLYKKQDSYEGGVEGASSSCKKRGRSGFSSYYHSGEGAGGSSICSKHQSTMNVFSKEELRKEACKELAKLFYTSAIPFNVVSNPFFESFLMMVAKHGVGFKPPSYHEIKETLLHEEVIEIRSLIEEHRIEWKKYGCSIIADGWIDRSRRFILNFMVNSHKGTVFLKSVDASDIVKDPQTIFKLLDDFVEQVGESNVIQVVTDNATNYIKAGELLMEKRPHLFWTPCIVHCIDLMLQDLEERIPLHKETIAKGRKVTTYIYGRTLLVSIMKSFTNGKDLIRRGISRFDTTYLTLGCLNELRTSLMTMFKSEKWKSSKFAGKEDGKMIENIIFDKEFWINVRTCLRVAYPLVKVLKLVDSKDQPAMGFIHKSMDHVQDEIKKALNNVKQRYEPILNIINERWINKMSKPLYLVGYYLNPRFFYSEGFRVTIEIKRAWYECLSKFTNSLDEADNIDIQLDVAKKKIGLFSLPNAKSMLHKKTPIDWWESFGVEVPELQRFAIRILSLTCSSSCYGREWSASKMVHIKRRNKLAAKKMNDLIYVMYNLKLKGRKPKATNEVHVDTFPYDDDDDDDWLADDEYEEGNDSDGNDMIDTMLVDESQRCNANDDLVIHDDDLEDDEIVRDVEICGDYGGLLA